MWKEESECLEWLDSRATCSVVYVSFGSVTVMTQQQLVEFCWGLAKSNYPFLWIIRPDLVIGDSAMLPPEFLKETSERSLLVGWCPQEQVLSHPSIGGFLTHSGWNSTLESISNGIPMICWPFFADQQPNCWWSCNKWGIAMVIDNNVKSDEVSRLVIELMNGDKGKGMRKNAMEWKKKADESCVAPVNSYVLKMKGYIDNLEHLGHPVTLGLGNYNMHGMRKTVNELHAMLKLYEQTLPKATLLLFMLFELVRSRKGLRASRKLKPRALSLYVGNGQREAVEAIGAFYLNSLIDQEVSGSLEDLEIIQEKDTHPSLDTSLNHEEDDLEIDEPQSDIVPIHRSTRIRHAPDRMCLYIDAEEHELGDLGELVNYKAALLDPESKKWLNAMNVEMQSMKDNEVWVLVELPPNGKTVGGKWPLKKKTDMNGNVHIYKARLVAKGYTQTSWIDYDKTFSPVADIKAIRILIAIAAYYDYEIWQMDVKTAFLNEYLNEEVYMEQPESFVNPKYPNRSSGSNITFLILYVDDILIMGNGIPMLQSVKTYLGKCFSMKDLGEAAYILGIKIYRDRSKRLIGLCQSAYIEKILKRYCMENSKRGSIHMQEKLKLSKSQGASTPAELKRRQNVSYASDVGSIMYAVRCTRPDVAFAQNVPSRFHQNPGDIHWTTVKNILKYLRNTKDMFLVYGCDLKRELMVSCYTDAGYLTDADDLKSQTGYVFVLNGGAVDWKSAKQSIFATSSTVAEYIVVFMLPRKLYGLGNSFLGWVWFPQLKNS
nr:7-deoxyloganetin glucosyltransferase-like [Tanacetum cinerariifolium]